MILYFSGTGNCLAISRKLAEGLNEQVLSLVKATKTDLTNEKKIGFVFPTYWFNVPKTVYETISELILPKNAYYFIVVPCGAQAGNAIWTIKRLLQKKGIKLGYCNKIRVPDNSAIGFGRNPNKQIWKFDKFAQRLNQIKKDIAISSFQHHFAWWDLISAIFALPFVEKRVKPMLCPACNEHKCIACGICVKVCPMGNIQTDNKGKITMGNNCAACLACIHFCPQQAMEIGKKPTPKEAQYHHPDIQLKDMLLR